MHLKNVGFANKSQILKIQQKVLNKKCGMIRLNVPNFYITKITFMVFKIQKTCNYFNFPKSTIILGFCLFFTQKVLFFKYNEKNRNVLFRIFFVTLFVVS